MVITSVIVSCAGEGTGIGIDEIVGVVGVVTVVNIVVCSTTV